MKTKFILSLASTAVVTALVIACNKSNSNSGTNPNNTTTATSTTQVQTQTDDETQVNTEMDAAENDINNSLNASAAFNGVGTTSENNGLVTDGGNGGIVLDYSICDGTVTTDTANGLRELIITYNGANCWGNRIRSGRIVITIPIGTHWKDQGAAVNVNIDTLKITRVKDHKTITLDGTYTFTNVSGGLLRNLASLGTITHTIAANNVTIMFADSATRTWSVSKQRVFTYNDGVVMTTSGTHSDGTNSDIAVWGTNRFGNAFETRFVQPKVIAQSCDWRLTSGETLTTRPALTMDITYGLDSSGNPTTCPGTGYYYYKAVWTVGGKTYTFIAPY